MLDDVTPFSWPARPPGMPGPPVPPRASGSSPWAVVAAVVVGLWIAGVTVVVQVAGWFLEQVLIVTGLSMPGWAWPLVCALDALLTGVPALLLALLPRSPAIRAAGRAWALAALLLLVLGWARAVPIEQNSWYLLLLALLAVVARVPLHGRAGALPPRRVSEYAPTVPADRRAMPLALAAGLASLLPWLLLASLGGLVETLLAIAAAAALGRLVAALLPAGFWANFAGSRARLIGLGGLVAGVALTPIAVGVGGSGVHLAELLALPPLGFALAAVARRPPAPAPAPPEVPLVIAAELPEAPPTGPPPPPRPPLRRWRPSPVAVLVGLAAFGPLGFVEPVQSSLQVGFRDVGFWALVAALIALGLALLFGLSYGLFLRRPAGRRWVAGLTAAGVGATCLVGYLAVGHPGLYGDRLFVVMKAQASMAGIDQIRDLPSRRAEAYRRLVATANSSQAPLRRELSGLHLAFTPFYLVNGIEVDSDGPAVRAFLSSRPGVDRVLLNPRLRPLPARAPQLSGSAHPSGTAQWNVSMIKADQVWAAGDTGKGIVIGTSDSGVDGTHPALAGNFRGGTDSWYDPWNGTRTPTDHNGHGTHTLGTAVGSGGIGVAPGAQWMGCVDLDRDMGAPAYYLSCLQFMLAPFPPGGDPLTDGRPARAADVLTNSWSCPALEGCDRSALRPAIDALTAAGIFVVAAAGNEGPRCGSIDDPPAPYPDTFTVGAMDSAGRVTDFSSRGPVAGGAKPDLVAPGADVLSALPGGGYGPMDGTSMATPHVAGVVALMWAANPRLAGDVPATARILRKTAMPVAAPAPGAPGQPGGTGQPAGTPAPAGPTANPTCGSASNLAGGGIVDAAAAVRGAKASVG